MAVETLRPNAFSYQGVGLEEPEAEAHHTLVDDVTPDEFSTVVISDDAEQFDLYGLPNHSEGSGTINKVTVYIRCNDDEVITHGDCKTVIKTHSTNYFGSAEVPGGQWATFSTEYALNPNTSAAWTWAEIDALEAGIWLLEADNYCTQVYVEVDYTPPAGIQIFRRRLEGN